MIFWSVKIESGTQEKRSTSNPFRIVFCFPPFFGHVVACHWCITEHTVNARIHPPFYFWLGMKGTRQKLSRQGSNWLSFSFFFRWVIISIGVYVGRVNERVTCFRCVLTCSASEGARFKAVMNLDVGYDWSGCQTNLHVQNSGDCRIVRLICQMLKKWNVCKKYKAEL